MAAVVTGNKTSSTDINPAMPAATLNTIWATAPENLTVGQVEFLRQAINTRAGGGNQAAVVGPMFP